jgi:hypothetical protein
MLVIPIPKKDMLALRGDGAKCNINGESVTLRLKDGYLLYKDSDGVNNRCKVLMMDDQGEAVCFMAASHGDDDEPHSIFGVDEKGEQADFLNPKRPLPGLPGGDPLN